VFAAFLEAQPEHSDLRSPLFRRKMQLLSSLPNYRTQSNCSNKSGRGSYITRISPELKKAELSSFSDKPALLPTAKPWPNRSFISMQKKITGLTAIRIDALSATEHFEDLGRLGGNINEVMLGENQCIVRQTTS